MATSGDILVVGCGVIGLTTALALAEAGARVRIVAHSLPPETTSAIAGALWGPYVVQDPRVLNWSLETLEAFQEASRVDGSGVRLVRGSEASRVMMTPPAWLHRFDDYRIVPASEVAPGYVMGWAYSAPIIEMPIYLNHLSLRLHEQGVSIDVVSPLRSLREVVGAAGAIVNCTGLGAKALVPDDDVVPSWGTLVVVDNPGITGFFSDYPEVDEPTYFIAHDDHVVLGGTIFGEVVDEGTAQAAVQGIRSRCSVVQPLLASAKIRSVRTGYRPVRPHVRLERTVIDGTAVVHNYGHGGAGVTLSWGCAHQVRDLLG
jgi:D-amino-acid oxidase